MGTSARDTTIVIGGSVAGLTAASALADRTGEVIVLERHPWPADESPATIAPQGAFAHVLLAGGAAALERLIPGFTDDLFDHGAVGRGRTGAHGHWWAAGAVRRSLPDDVLGLPMCSRSLVESRLRAHVRSRSNVTVLDGLVVRGLRIDGGRVTGVDAERDGEAFTLDADLVVDASGRGSRSPAWLRRAGIAEPPVSRVEVGLTYTGIDVRRHTCDLDGGLFAVVQNTPDLARIGVALPTEAGGWKVVLGGYFGDAASPTREDIMAFAASLPDPVMLQLLENEWLGAPTQYKFPSSQRRHFEKVRGLPAGFCAIGDAVASFNPLYGQGMSAAALQVEVLARCIDRHGNSARLPRAVARGAARVVANPWQIATGADFVYPQTVGPKPPGTDRINRYVAKVIVAAASDEVVNAAFTRVQQLLAPPTSLFAPRVVRRVRKAARRHSAPHHVLVPAG